MDTCSSYFNHPLALELDDKHFKMYGTRDLDTIELIKEFNDKNAEEIANKLADEKAEAKFNIIKEEFKLATIKEANEAYLVKKGNSISTLSPFITEYVDVNGQRLFRQDFIRDKIKRDPLYSERQLVKNAYNGNWQRMFKTKGPEFVSDVDVVAGFIVNVRAFGNSAPLVVYIKGRDNPLHFKNGNLSTHNIMKELQLEDKSFDGKWVAEAFKRSLCMCQNIWFLSIPEHMGGYKLPDGSLTYVSSSSVIPGLEAYFSPEIKTHVLITHEHSFEEVTEDYNLALPKSWKIKTLVVDRVSCILLPFFEEESLRPDRTRIVSYVGEKEKHGIIALTKRVNYQSTVVKSLLDRRTNVKEDLSTMNDLPIIYSFSSTIENRGITDNKFNDIRLSLLGEDGIEFPTRNIVTILSETPASIPDNLPAYHLSVDENIDFGDVSMLQQMTGAFDFSIIQFLYSNQDAARSIVCKAIEKAHISARMIRDAEITQSMIIFLATAHILKKISIITESELVSMIKWFSDKATSRACVSDKLVYDISIAINKEICSGKLKLSKQYEPPYFKNDGKTAFIADNDGSVNVDDETFEAVFLANIKSTDRRNMILKALKEKRKLISTKSYKRDLKVKFDDGLVEYISVYSFSPSILSNEAKEIVNKMLITDRFLQHQSCPDNFCSYIVHKRYNAVAGQVIKNYNNINPFTAVCGSPGSGKTDLLMMQSLQRAKAGDTVIILDSTNSFCEYEWGQHKVPKEIVDEMIVFWDMSTKGWLVDIIDFSDCHNIQQKREQLFSLLMSGSHLTGFNQISILLNAVDKMIKQLENGETNLYRCIINSFELKSEDRKVMNRVLSMFSTIAIESPHNMSWEKLLEMNGRIIVVSTGNATVKADVNPLDVILDSFYSYKDSHREGNVTLVLDEIQAMNLNEGAPIDTVLSKGRKLNISAFLASQRYSKGKDRLGRAFDYCDTKLFYRPMESCIEAVSEKTHIPTDVLRCLDQGECVFVGTAYSKHFGKNIPLRSALIGRTLRPPYVGSYNNGEQ